MSFLGDTLAEIAGALLHGILFTSGEVLRWAVTLGRHRVRWWEVQDDNVAWPSILLGILFWGGVLAGLLWILVG